MIIKNILQNIISYSITIVIIITSVHGHDEIQYRYDYQHRLFIEYKKKKSSTLHTFRSCSIFHVFSTFPEVIYYDTCCALC